MQTQTISQDSNNNGMTAIERALAAAKARKAAKVASGLIEETSAPAEKPAKVKAEKPAKEPKVAKAKASDADRDAAKAKREEERAARAAAKEEKLKAEAETKAAKKAEREAAKAAKAAAKAAEKSAKKPAHMKKVERARAKCPPLSSEAEKLFAEITCNLSAGQIDALAQHLGVHNRATATILATQLEPLPLGATVRITGGEAKYIGAVGEVVHSQKLRAKVQVPGVSKPVYIYNGQAEVVTAEAAVAV